MAEAAELGGEEARVGGELGPPGGPGPLPAGRPRGHTCPGRDTVSRRSSTGPGHLSWTFR